MSENSDPNASQDPEGPSKVKEKQTKNKKRPFDPENLIGETLGGRYAVEKCIGRGGMGVVYLASQNALNRNVVVKVLPRSFVDDDEAIARFEREAVGMSRLQHPHIVSIYDFGHEDDQAYICMEYVEGETLSRRIKSQQRRWTLAPSAPSPSRFSRASAKLTRWGWSTETSSRRISC